MRYIATFNPEAWVNDYAYPVDPQGEQSWDCTSYIGTILSPEEIEQFLTGHETYNTDCVRDDPNAPAWVRDWSGPFNIDLTEVDETDPIG